MEIPFKYHSTEWRNVAKLNTGYWFSSETLRFFGSRISWATIRKVSAGWLFVTSEFTSPRKEARAYSLRLVTPDGNIETLGDFLAYETLAEAKKALTKKAGE